MNIIKLSEKDSEKPENYDEMLAWFKERTQRHINLVQGFAEEIEHYDPERFKGLVKQTKDHDQSKFEDPEIEPYVFITWDYKCKDDGIDFEIPKPMQNRADRATEHHIKNLLNKHHPEAHCDKEADLINKEDRDKPVRDKVIDATDMPELDVAEMCADWMAMSEEKGNTPKSWANKNVNIRWKFTDEQKDLIYELIDNVWS